MSDIRKYITLLENAERLDEAKEIIDLRHENKEDTIPYFGAEKTSGYIHPNDGVYFEYLDGVLVLSSTNNPNYSFNVLYKNSEKHSDLKKKLRKFFNVMGGMINFSERTLTINKEYIGNRKVMSAMEHYDIFKKALKELLKIDLIDKNYKIKGVPSHVPKVVSKALEYDSPDEHMFDTKDLYLYHGTSFERAEDILKKGLRPNPKNDYIDKVDDYSEYNVYLASSPEGARFYAKRQMAKDGTKNWAILKVRVPDKAKLRGDDALINSNNKSISGTGDVVKLSYKTQGEIAYKGTIHPNNISLFKSNVKRKK